MSLSLCCSTVSVALILTYLSFIEHCFYKLYGNIFWWPLGFPAKQNFIMIASCVVWLVNKKFYVRYINRYLLQAFFINGNNCSNILRCFTNENNTRLFHKFVVIISKYNTHNMHSMARFSKPFCHGFSILLRQKFHRKVNNYESSFVINIFNYFSFLFFLMYHYENVMLHKSWKKVYNKIWLVAPRNKPVKMSSKNICLWFLCCF